MTRTFAAFLLFSVTALAADTFPVDPPILRKLSRPAPFRAEFSNKVSFRLPDTLRFVTEDKLPEFADRMKLALVGDEAGALAPDDMAWYAMIYVIKDDPLNGQADLANLNKEAITAWHEKFTTDHTARRVGSGKVWKLGNYTHPPAWNPEKKHLTMGVRMSTDGSDSNVIMNYKMFVYGPEKQIICFQIIAPMADGKWEQPVNRISPKLAEELTFPVVQPETNANEEMMYYGKLVGGGLIGAIVVVIAAKVLLGGRRSTMGAGRRPSGLPR